MFGLFDLEFAKGKSRRYFTALNMSDDSYLRVVDLPKPTLPIYHLL